MRNSKQGRIMQALTAGLVIAATIAASPLAAEALDGHSAQPDTLDIVEDSGPTSIDVLANDDLVVIDEIESFTQGTKGTVTQGPGETLIYTPNDNENGEDTFTYSATFPPGPFGDGTTTATVTVNIEAVNDEPTIYDDYLDVEEDDEATIEVIFWDVEDTDLMLEIDTPPTMGSIEIADRDQLTYTPDPNKNGEDTFTLSATDSDGATTTAEFEVVIYPVNDIPQAVECGPYTVQTGNSIDIDAPACGTDIEDETLTVIGESVTASNGTIVGNEDGTLTYTPAEEFEGTATINFTLVDNGEFGKGPRRGPEGPESRFAFLDYEDEFGTVDITVEVEVTAAAVEPEPEPEPEPPYAGAKDEEGEVVRMYKALLGRTPDGGGFTYWTDLRKTDLTLEDLVSQFTDSDEFKAIYGDRIANDTNSEWVDFIYSEIMDRTPDAAGRAYWIALLDQDGISRQAMVVFFANSAENKALTQTS